MPEPGRATPRTWISLAVFVVWTAAALALGGAALSGLERFGSAADWAILTGTARVESCAPSWFGAPYECRAEVTWTDRITGEPWSEEVAVYAMSSLSGDVAVERRTDDDRKADERHGRVYPVGHPVQPARTAGVLGVFAMFLATLFVPVAILRCRRNRGDGGRPAPATDLDRAARRAAEKRRRRRRN